MKEEESEEEEEDPDDTFNVININMQSNPLQSDHLQGIT